MGVIVTLFRLSIQGFFVVSSSKKTEAAETINAVNARYGYKPEFHEIYAQVGAAIASKKALPPKGRSECR